MLNLFQRAAVLYEHPVGFSDVGMHDAVCEILDVNHCRLIRFLPTDHEHPWPDGRDRNLNGFRGLLEGALDVRDLHYRLGCEVEMEDPATEVCFVHLADSWKAGSRHGLLPFVTSFDKVQKLLLLWRAQHKAHGLGEKVNSPERGT
jgi:hypothetical protein